MPAANVGRRTAGEGSGHKNVFPPGCVSHRDSVVSEAGIRERKKASVVGVVLAVSVLLNYVYDILAKSNTYVGLYKRHPWYLVESIDKFAVLLLCFAALCYLYRCGLKGVLEELRLFRVLWYGIGTIVLCTMPMLVGFALTRRN